MRILGALAGGEHGGAETFFTRLMIGLHQSQVETKVLLKPFQSRVEKLTKAGVQWTSAPFGGLFDFKTGALFKKEFNSFHPDIVLTFMNRATAKCPIARKHNILHLARLGGYYNLKYYKNADFLIALTHDIQDYIIQNGWPREKVHYLPNFADQIQGNPLSKKEFNTPEDAPLLLTLARLHQAKAIDVLLKSIQNLKDAYLWVAGEGPLRAELENMAKTLSVDQRVRFLGWRQDIPDLIATSDIVVFPSRYEPHGTVVLEAWANERPLVAAASKGPAGLIKNNENGLLVPIDDPEALSKAIQKIMDSPNLAAELVIRGKETYDQNHSATAVLGQYIELFERILKLSQK